MREIRIQEESRKIIYIDDEEVGQFKMNGSLKLYKTEEAKYGELEQLFEGRAIPVPINNHGQN